MIVLGCVHQFAASVSGTALGCRPSSVRWFTRFSDVFPIGWWWCVVPLRLEASTVKRETAPTSGAALGCRPSSVRWPLSCPSVVAAPTKVTVCCVWGYLWDLAVGNLDQQKPHWDVGLPVSADLVAFLVCSSLEIVVTEVHLCDSRPPQPRKTAPIKGTALGFRPSSVPDSWAVPLVWLPRRRWLILGSQDVCLWDAVVSVLPVSFACRFCKCYSQNSFGANIL